MTKWWHKVGAPECVASVVMLVAVVSTIGQVIAIVTVAVLWFAMVAALGALAWWASEAIARGCAWVRDRRAAKAWRQARLKPFGSIPEPMSELTPEEADAITRASWPDYAIDHLNCERARAGLPPYRTERRQR